MSAQSNQTGAYSIMIVDDDDDNRAVVKTILTSNGYEVSEAAGGKQALEILKSHTPALILLDIMMPEMSGYDVVVHLKQQPSTQNIPIIMLTAKGEADDLIAGYKDYGVDYYITKPFTTRQLVAGIKLVLG
jgi:CheY-like chemotaxis protein